MKDGTNTYTAMAKDAYGRSDTNTVSVFLPVSTSFAYDLNGNMLSDGRRGFEYDDENQLIRVTMTNTWKSEFVYDGKMRRRERIECTWNGSEWVTNEIVHYIYDGNLVLQERHYNNPQLPTLNPQLVTYTRGKDLSGTTQGAGGIGGLLARSEISNLQSPHSYYHADGNGNVTCLVNAQNAIVAKYIYDPYGNMISASGPLAEANLYRFSSKEWHVQSGLVYYLYRYYEPNLQRWISREPYGEYFGPNLFLFCRNDSVRFVDRFGESPVTFPTSSDEPPPLYPPRPPNWQPRFPEHPASADKDKGIQNTSGNAPPMRCPPVASACDPINDPPGKFTPSKKTKVMTCPCTGEVEVQCAERRECVFHSMGASSSSGPVGTWQTVTHCDCPEYALYLNTK